MIRHAAGLLACLGLGACAGQGPTLASLPRPGDLRGTERPPAIASVRHVPSNDAYGDARLHLFVIQPAAPRSLAARKRAARAALRRDPACRWVDAPDDVLRAETAKQGARYAESYLVAPVRCT